MKAAVAAKALPSSAGSVSRSVSPKVNPSLCGSTGARAGSTLGGPAGVGLATLGGSRAQRARRRRLGAAGDSGRPMAEPRATLREALASRRPGGDGRPAMPTSRARCAAARSCPPPRISLASGLAAAGRPALPTSRRCRRWTKIPELASSRCGSPAVNREAPCRHRVGQGPKKNGGDTDIGGPDRRLDRPSYPEGPLINDREETKRRGAAREARRSYGSSARRRVSQSIDLQRHVDVGSSQEVTAIVMVTIVID